MVLLLILMLLNNLKGVLYWDGGGGGGCGKSTSRYHRHQFLLSKIAHRIKK